MEAVADRNQADRRCICGCDAEGQEQLFPISGFLIFLLSRSREQVRPQSFTLHIIQPRNPHLIVPRSLDFTDLPLQNVNVLT